MRLRLRLLFLMLVLVPMACVAWLGWRVQKQEREALRDRLRQVLEGSLEQNAATVATLLDQRAREIDALLPDSPAPDNLREVTRSSPVVSQAFAISSIGDPIFPATTVSLTPMETEFMTRTSGLWSAGAFGTRPRMVYRADPVSSKILATRNIEPAQQSVQAPTRESPAIADKKPPPQTIVRQKAAAAVKPLSKSPEQSQQTATQSASTISVSNASSPSRGQVSFENPSPGGEPAADTGWYAWQWGRTLRTLWWKRLPEGEIVGAELDPVRLTSEVIARLPETNSERPSPPDGQIRLVDSAGAVLYQWGGYTPRAGETSVASLPLAYPLSSWRLDYFTPALAAVGTASGLWAGIAPGLIAMALAVVAVAIWFWRESNRDFREAATRVTFVNQVSHELKTPLTNIRMYAELLEDELADTELSPGATTTVENDAAIDRPRRYLQIIGAESRRLSRLIANILTFSMRERGKLSLRMGVGVPDETVSRVLDSFREPLAVRGITRIETDLHAERAVRLDEDALGQILANLLGNVEKYAASGDALHIATSQHDGLTTIIVADSGPGIPHALRESIFHPFYRAQNRLTEGVTGTGIGLTIARDLARLHGGDLRLLTPDKVFVDAQGAVFAVELRTPEVSDE